MKKCIATLLSTAILLTSFVQVFAAEQTDSGLENAITNAKTKIEVPKEYTKFDYSVNGYNGEKSWRLVWSSDDKSMVRGQVNVTIDDSGFISAYDSYSPSQDAAPTSKLPKYSRQSAEDSAKAFIERIQPGLSSKLEAQEDNYNTYIGSRFYYFNFHYVQDGTPYYGYNCNISVDGNTGEVRNYYGTKTSNLVFPAKNGVIGADDIQKILKDSKALELRYMQAFDDSKIIIFPAYVLTEAGKSQYDAFTGKVVTGLTNRVFYDSAAYGEKMSISATSSSVKDSNAITLNEQELDAVKKIANVMSKEDAEKIIRAIPELKLDDSYKTNYFNLYKDYKNKDQYTWNMSFQKEVKKETTEKIINNNYISVTINAETGKLISFHTGYNGNPVTEYKVDYNTAKSTAEALAKRLEPEKFAQTEFISERSTPEDIKPIAYRSPAYSFTFRRVVNNVPCEGDTITIGVDGTAGNVTNYSIDWYNGDFPALENAITLDQAYEKLFENVQVKLYYVNTQPSADLLPQKETPTTNYEIKLVYMMNTTKPAIIDVKTGGLLDYQGKPYVEKVITPYTDINGHFSEQAVKILQEYGIGFDSDKFLPDQEIKQSEFLELLLKTVDSYYAQYYKNDEDKQKYIYESLVRMGIVKKDEIAPDSILKREEAVKFIVRQMGLQKAADIKGIYVSNFTDESEISQDLLGYVCIAKGLNLISGFDNKFLPKQAMTRGEAAILIYNSLK